MIDPPKTRAEAERRRYQRNDVRYCPDQCAYEVWDFSGWQLHQCSRKPGHGPEGLYCKQHAKMVGNGE